MSGLRPVAFLAAFLFRTFSRTTASLTLFSSSCDMSRLSLPLFIFKDFALKDGLPVGDSGAEESKESGKDDVDCRLAVLSFRLFPCVTTEDDSEVLDPNVELRSSGAADFAFFWNVFCFSSCFL